VATLLKTHRQAACMQGTQSEAALRATTCCTDIMFVGPITLTMSKPLRTVMHTSVTHPDVLVFWCPPCCRKLVAAALMTAPAWNAQLSLVLSRRAWSKCATAAAMLVPLCIPAHSMRMEVLIHHSRLHVQRRSPQLAGCTALLCQRMLYNDCKNCGCTLCCVIMQCHSRDLTDQLYNLLTAPCVL
jgi:hypothetical protein